MRKCYPLKIKGLKQNKQTKNMSENKCDICDSTKNVVAGRWIFYCPKHKQNDIDKTFENEINPDIESGNFDNIDGELSEMILNNF